MKRMYPSPSGGAPPNNPPTSPSASLPPAKRLAPSCAPLPPPAELAASASSFSQPAKFQNPSQSLRPLSLPPTSQLAPDGAHALPARHTSASPRRGPESIGRRSPRSQDNGENEKDRGSGVGGVEKKGNGSDGPSQKNAVNLAEKDRVEGPGDPYARSSDVRAITNAYDTAGPLSPKSRPPVYMAPTASASGMVAPPPLPPPQQPRSLLDPSALMEPSPTSPSNTGAVAPSRLPTPRALDHQRLQNHHQLTQPPPPQQRAQAHSTQNNPQHELQRHQLPEQYPAQQHQDSQHQRQHLPYSSRGPSVGAHGDVGSHGGNAGGELVPAGRGGPGHSHPQRDSLPVIGHPPPQQPHSPSLRISDAHGGMRPLMHPQQHQQQHPQESPVQHQGSRSFQQAQAPTAVLPPAAAQPDPQRTRLPTTQPHGRVPPNQAGHLRSSPGVVLRADESGGRPLPRAQPGPAMGTGRMPSGTSRAPVRSRSLNTERLNATAVNMLAEFLRTNHPSLAPLAPEFWTITDELLDRALQDLFRTVHKPGIPVQHHNGPLDYSATTLKSYFSSLSRVFSANRPSTKGFHAEPFRSGVSKALDERIRFMRDEVNMRKAQSQIQIANGFQGRYEPARHGGVHGGSGDPRLRRDGPQRAGSSSRGVYTAPVSQGRGRGGHGYGSGYGGPMDAAPAATGQALQGGNGGEASRADGGDEGTPGTYLVDRAGNIIETSDIAMPDSHFIMHWTAVCGASDPIKHLLRLFIIVTSLVGDENGFLSQIRTSDFTRRTVSKGRFEGRKSLIFDVGSVRARTSALASQSGVRNSGIPEASERNAAGRGSNVESRDAPGGNASGDPSDSTRTTDSLCVIDMPEMGDGNCYVTLVEYLDNRPQGVSDAFWLTCVRDRSAPRDRFYTSTPMGSDDVSKLIKELYRETGLTHPMNLVNHSIRVRSIQKKGRYSDGEGGGSSDLPGGSSQDALVLSDVAPFTCPVARRRSEDNTAAAQQVIPRGGEVGGPECDKVTLIVKLGGAALTNKHTKRALAPKDRFDGTVFAVASAHKNRTRLLVCMGAGSFGHFEAAEHKVSSGSGNEHGVAATHAAVSTLAAYVVDSLAKHGVPAVSLSPLHCQLCGSTLHIAITAALKRGFVPVVHGDAVYRESSEKKSSILSADDIIATLATSGAFPNLRRAVFVSDVAGVFVSPPTGSNADRNVSATAGPLCAGSAGAEPSRDGLVRRIVVGSDGSVISANKPLFESATKMGRVDETGGMKAKVEQAASIAVKNGGRTQIYIVGAGTPSMTGVMDMRQEPSAEILDGCTTVECRPQKSGGNADQS